MLLYFSSNHLKTIIQGVSNINGQNLGAGGTRAILNKNLIILTIFLRPLSFFISFAQLEKEYS